MPSEVSGVFKHGDNGNNVLHDTHFNDFIFGYGGNDTIVADAITDAPNGIVDYNKDRFDGGSGTDTVDYSNVAKASGYGSVYVDLDLADNEAFRVVNGVSSNRDVLVSIENAIGSDYGDKLRGNSVANKFEGGDGNDTLWGEGGNDLLYGQNGADYIYGGDGNDKAYGGNHNDHLYGNNGHDELFGQSGNDWLLGGDGNDELSGGSGVDHLYGNDGHDDIDGGTGADIIYGHDGHDELFGNHDDDKIYGGSGNDKINGGRGDDELDGGAGTDTYVHEGGVSVDVNLFVGTAENVFGTDTLTNFENVKTGSGSDSIFGDTSGNVIQSGAGDDVIIGYAGNNFIYGGSGDEYIVAGSGNDWVFGEGDDDEIYGQVGTDKLYGGGGKDKLHGGDDNDQIRGDGGNDLIIGGAGADNIKGGSGADVFRWEDGDIGTDQILDFVVGVDKISFGEDFFAGDPAAQGNYAGLLSAVAAPGFANTSMLYANTQDAGWQNIAFFHNVHVNSLQNGIFSKSIFAAEVNEVFLPTTNELFFG